MKLTKLAEQQYAQSKHSAPLMSLLLNLLSPLLLLSTLLAGVIVAVQTYVCVLHRNHQVSAGAYNTPSALYMAACHALLCFKESLSNSNLSRL